MATLVRTPEGFFQQGSAGLVPITDPVQLRDLNAGNTPYIDQSGAADVSSPTVTQSSLPQKPVVPTTSGGSTGSTTAPAGGNPYTIFNQNMASLLTSIQKAQTTGSASLGSGIATDTNVGESPNGATDFNPTVSASVQSSGRQALSDAYQPVIASENTRLTNTTNALNALSGSVQTMLDAYKPQVVSPGQSLVSPDGTIIKQGHNYTFQLNPNTGGFDGYDATTGTWASQDNAGNGPTPVLAAPGAQGSTIVGGVELGASADGSIKPWATSPTAAHQVNNIYNDIKANIPVPGAPAYDAYIKNNGGGPVTGSMIMNSAKLHNIDPSLLAAVLNNESDFGSSGVAVKDNNVGGITYTGAAGQVQGTSRGAEGGFYVKYNSLSQGVDAVAQELQNRIVSPDQPQTQTTTKGGTDPKGNVISPQYQTRVAQLPSVIQNYVLAGPGGVAYVDGTTVDTIGKGVDTLAAIAAPKAGIPVLDSTAESQLNSLNTIAQQAQSMHALIDANLKGGLGSDNSTVGHLLNSLTSGTNKLAQNQTALTEMQTYIGNVTTAAENIKALAGGSGSGVRITGFEIGNAASDFPQPSDSWQQAEAKMKALDLKVAQALHGVFPDYQAGDINNPNAVQPASQTASAGNSGGTGGGMVTMTGPKGTYQVTPDKVATMQQNGYTVQ